MGHNMSVENRALNLISGIRIGRLFGRYDYDLRIPSSEDNQIARMALLYGDNGTGKTTILKLLFHLLSPADKQGHRTFLARVPFSNFSVLFSNGIVISSVRAQTELTGRYILRIKESDGTSLDGAVQTENGRVTDESISPEAIKIVDRIADLKLTTFLLGDDRMLQSDKFPREPRDRYYIHGQEDIGLEAPRTAASPDLRDLAVHISLERTSTWLRQHLIQASSRGEAEAQHIYAGIVEDINRVGVPQKKDYARQKKKLLQELKALENRGRSFTDFGLISRINIKRLADGMKNASSNKHAFVAQVIRSFIDGQQARLNALDDLNRRLDQFVELINRFLRDKRIRIEVGKGISIVSDSNASLRPEYLSSGEKQLLLLFCNVLTSSESASLFLIDEPELSLNVKWQRQLIDALTDITSGSPCQFILATHSIELLAKHRELVIKLDPS